MRGSEKCHEKKDHGKKIELIFKNFGLVDISN